MKEYDRHSLYFVYPDNWELDESEMNTPHGAVQLAGETGGFWLLKKYPRGTSPDAVAQECVNAMRSEYTDMEVERFDKMMYGKSVIGFEMTFFYLDLMNMAMVYCFEHQSQMLAVFWQTGNQLIIMDEEEIPVEKVLEAVTISLLRGERIPMN